MADHGVPVSRWRISPPRASPYLLGCLHFEPPLARRPACKSSSRPLRTTDGMGRSSRTGIFFVLDKAATAGMDVPDRKHAWIVDYWIWPATSGLTSRSGSHRDDDLQRTQDGKGRWEGDGCWMSQNCRLHVGVGWIFVKNRPVSGVGSRSTKPLASGPPHSPPPTPALQRSLINPARLLTRRR